MPPPKKAAKKAAKKTAKKSADHHHVKHHEANDMRRAYEHMGRLEVLQGLLKPAAAKTIVELSKLAHDAIGGGHNKEAADLLRASEHLSFALLGGDHGFGGSVSSELERAITEHFDELMRRADKHWNEEKRTGIFIEVYESARDSAAMAFKSRAFHQALEFARASEALAHVKQHGPVKLRSGHRTLKLKSV